MTYYSIKKVRPDYEVLNDIMMRSLAVWGYSSKELEEASEVLEITIEFLDKSICYVAELDGLIKGFFCIEPSRDEELSKAKFYIEPNSMRLGLGTRLWNKVIYELKNHEVKSFKFLIAPNAQGFYEKLGAVKIGERRSDVIEECIIPIMKYTISEN